MENKMFEMRQKFLNSCLLIVQEQFENKNFESFEFQSVLMGASFLRGKNHKKAEKSYLEMATDILDCLVDRGDLITNKRFNSKAYLVKGKE